MIISNNVCVNNSFTPSPKVMYNPGFCGLSVLKKEIADTFVSSNPAKKNTLSDVFQKIFNPQDNPLNIKNIREFIVNTVSSKTKATGKDAMVFQIPNHDDVVLRVEKSVLEDLHNLPEDLRILPIRYDKNIEQNNHFGLPLYIISDKSAPLSSKEFVSPQEALKSPNKIMILKRVFGQHPSADYFEKFTEFMGSGEVPDVHQFLNFKMLTHVRGKYGIDATIKFLENCKNGVETIPENYFANGSEKLEVFNPKQFYENYKSFKDSYIKSLKDISDFPQKAYNDAVSTILSPKDFIMDFQHTNNTFVDLDKKEFNFMDFVFDKSMYPKYHYDNPIKEFRNVLMGKCFSSKFPTPRVFIMYPEDIKAVKKYSTIINDKVNIASPDKFKSECPFA